MFTTSPSGIALIKSFEKCKLVAYADSGGVMTIGWGHTANAGGPAVTPGLRITQETADRIFELDLRKFEAAVNRLIAQGARLTQHQFDALVSFHYNTGKLTAKTCSIPGLVLKGKLDQVPGVMLRYVRCQGNVLRGLQRRRAAEVVLWNKADPNVRTQEVDDAVDFGGLHQDIGADSRSVLQSKIANGALVGGAASLWETANTAVTSAGNTVSNLKETLGVDGENITVAQLFHGVSGIIGSITSNPTFLLLLGVTILCGLIWWWRYQNLKEFLL